MEVLEKKRSRIDFLDKKIVEALIERFSVVLEIKQVKKELNLPIENIDREKRIISMIESIVNKEYVDEVTEVYQTIFKVSKDLQK